MDRRRSLGGIGHLYSDDVLQGDVYYNIQKNQPPGKVMCTLVFVGRDIELAGGTTRYRLVLEDGSYLFIVLLGTRAAPNLPYTFVSPDGIFHAVHAGSE